MATGLFPLDIYRHLFLYAPDPQTFIRLLQLSRPIQKCGEELKKVKLGDYTKTIRRKKTTYRGESTYRVLPNGMKHGPYVLYYTNNPRADLSFYWCKEVTYYLGKKEGEQRLWHCAIPKGSKISRVKTAIAEKRYFINGLEEGICQAWHENGQTEYIYSFHKGQREGSYKEWFSNGDLYEESYYKEGKLEGRQTIYHGKGITRGGEYRAGVPFGLHSDYDECNDRVYYILYDEKGQEIKRIY